MYIFLQKLPLLLMSPDIVVKDANSSSIMNELFDVRRKVFVIEQGVSKQEEYDEFETSSRHLIATIDNRVIGTCRFRNTDKGVKLERFAVLEEARQCGVGAALLKGCLSRQISGTYVYLHAQIQVVDFYSKYGFQKVGSLFEEANIQHYKMEKTV